MFSISSKIRKTLSVFLLLQAIAFIAAQPPLNTTPTTPSINNGIGVIDVSTKVDDYIQENWRHYNATLQNYLNQINNIKQSLEDQLKVLDKQKTLVINTIQETNEKIYPLEMLSFTTKYCVQLYGSDLPYGDIVAKNIESCITNARSYSNSIVSSPTGYYNILNNYYNTNLKKELIECGKYNINPTLNHTLCVTKVIARANAYTITNRKNFATAIESSKCAVNSRIDVAVSCTYTNLNDALESIGETNRVIDDCIKDYLEKKPTQPCINDNTTATYGGGCPNVVYMEVNDGYFQNGTITNPLQVSPAIGNCLEIRYVEKENVLYA